MTSLENTRRKLLYCIFHLSDGGEKGKEGGRVGEKNNSGKRQEWRQIGQKRNVSADGRGEEWRGRREEEWRGVEEKGGDGWERREMKAGGIDLVWRRVGEKGISGRWERRGMAAGGREGK